MFKIIKFGNSILDKMYDAVFILLFLIGAYFIVDSYLVYNAATVDNALAYKPTEGNPENLMGLENAVAWITIDNTTIDYPIMQGKDNIEYLNKDSFGAYSLSGSIFLDSRNSPKFTDSYSLVYGHHMSGGYMFGALDNFADEKYFDEHRTGALIVDGQFYEIETIAFYHTDANESIIFNLDIEANRNDFLKEKADIFKGNDGGRIIALSTCTSPTSTKRTVLFVRILEN